MAVSDYSTTPSSNTSISGINIAEGCPPGNVNNAIRQLMADVKGYTATVIPFSPPSGFSATTVADAIAEAKSDAIAAIPGAATTSAAGLMSAEDKTKLNGIAPGAGVTAALASQSEAEAGSDNAKTMTALRVEQHMLANALGWGQTWQDVKSSRSPGTSYQNTTGRPIQLAITIENEPWEVRVLQVSSNGSTWVEVGSSPAVGGSAPRNTISIIVPAGHYYRIEGSSSVNIRTWAELR